MWKIWERWSKNKQLRSCDCTSAHTRLWMGMWFGNELLRKNNFYETIYFDLSFFGITTGVCRLFRSNGHAVRVKSDPFWHLTGLIINIIDIIFFHSEIWWISKVTQIHKEHKKCNYKCNCNCTGIHSVSGSDLTHFH